MEYVIRELKKDEYTVLDEFLYLAIFVPEGAEPPPKDIITKPELQVYVRDFGCEKGDYAYGAFIGKQIVGCVWVRIMDDYGHIDDDTPSFAISVYEQYRGKGIGTGLMRTMLERLKNDGYRQASLAVQKENKAVSMYKRAGFETVSQNDEEYIMVCKLN